MNTSCGAPLFLTSRVLCKKQWSVTCLEYIEPVKLSKAATVAEYSRGWIFDGTCDVVEARSHVTFLSIEKNKRMTIIVAIRVYEVCMIDITHGVPCPYPTDYYQFQRCD